MTQEFLKTLLEATDAAKIKSAFEPYKLACGDKDFDTYENKDHAINNKAKFPDKTVTDTDEDGKPVSSRNVPITRIPLPYQKRIVRIAAAMLGVPSLKATPKDKPETDHLAVINRILSDNKFEYKFREIVKLTKSEKQSAVIFYTQDAETGFYDGVNFSSKQKIRMRVIAGSKGDEMYPVFDEYGDMIAFGRSYKHKTNDNKEIEKLEIYTADKLIFFTNDGGWSAPDVSANPMKKIPVVYFKQNHYEWEDIQDAINRKEAVHSKHADTNEYFGSPMFKAKGKINGFAKKGEAGIVLEMDESADAEYLTWDSQPASQKLEIDQLKSMIETFTQTPDISFDSVKGIGSISGAALKLLFSDAHMKAADSEEIFGEGMQRVINFLKNAVNILGGTSVTMDISPKFSYFTINDEKEQLDMIINAKNAGILSVETAVRLNPLVGNADEEILKINGTQQPTV